MGCSWSSFVGDGRAGTDVRAARAKGAPQIRRLIDRAGRAGCRGSAGRDDESRRPAPGDVGQQRRARPRCAARRERTGRTRCRTRRCRPAAEAEQPTDAAAQCPQHPLAADAVRPWSLQRRRRARAASARRGAARSPRPGTARWPRAVVLVAGRHRAGARRDRERDVEERLARQDGRSDAPGATAGGRPGRRRSARRGCAIATTRRGAGAPSAGESVRGRGDDRRDRCRSDASAGRASGVGSRNPPRSSLEEALGAGGHGQLKGRCGYGGGVEVIAFVIGVVLLVVGLAVSIALHELGHLWPAKKFGVRVGQYMIGFGPTLWSWRRGETAVRLQGHPARRLHLDGGHVPALDLARARSAGHRSGRAGGGILRDDGPGRALRQRRDAAQRGRRPGLLPAPRLAAHRHHARRPGHEPAVRDRAVRDPAVRHRRCRRRRPPSSPSASA